MSNKVYKQSYDSKAFMRQGKAGTWKESLSPELIKKFDDWEREGLKGSTLSFKYDWDEINAHYYLHKVLFEYWIFLLICNASLYHHFFVQLKSHAMKQTRAKVPMIFLGGKLNFFMSEGGGGGGGKNLLELWHLFSVVIAPCAWLAGSNLHLCKMEGN